MPPFAKLAAWAMSSVFCSPHHSNRSAGKASDEDAFTPPRVNANQPLLKEKNGQNFDRKGQKKNSAKLTA